MPPRFAPTKLANWPWVVVRLDCVLCTRKGCYRLARLAARYGPEQSIDGLLRDLCQDCPWFNERLPQFELRCGARFTDLEINLPPIDHPDQPISRQRQPARENLPKPRVNRFPDGYGGGTPTLANWQGAEMVLACKDCGRRETFSVVDLRGRLPIETMLVDLRVTLSTDCPRRQGVHSIVQCGAVIVEAGPK